MYIYIYLYMYWYIYIWMYVFLYVYIYLYVHSFSYLHLYIYLYTYVYTFTFIYIHIYIYLLSTTMYIYTYIHICIYTHICIHYRVVAWCEMLQQMLQHPATCLNILRNTASHCNTPAPWKHPNSIDMGNPPILQAKNRSFLIAGVDNKYLYDAADGRYNFSKFSLATRFAM